MQVSSWSSWFLCLHLHLAPPNSNRSELHTVPLLYACCILSFRFLSIWHSYSFFQVCSQVTISGDFAELGRDKTFLICWDPCWEWSEFQRITPSAEKIKQHGSRGFASILKVTRFLLPGFSFQRIRTRSEDSYSLDLICILWVKWGSEALGSNPTSLPFSPPSC